MLWIREVEMKIQQTHDNRDLTISELSQLKMLVVIEIALCQYAIAQRIRSIVD